MIGDMRDEKSLPARITNDTILVRHVGQCTKRRKTSELGPSRGLQTNGRANGDSRSGIGAGPEANRDEIQCRKTIAKLFQSGEERAGMTAIIRKRYDSWSAILRQPSYAALRRRIFERENVHGADPSRMLRPSSPFISK